MDSIKSFLTKHKVWVLSGFIVLFFIRSCNRNRSITKLEKTSISQTEQLDSLSIFVKTQENQIDSFPEVLRTEKLNIYLSIDDTISRVDRSPQLMNIHKIIKDSIKSLQK